MKKIALITGASSGMGRETAIQLADLYGQKIDEFWLVARRLDRLKELLGTVPATLRFFQIDLAAPASLTPLKDALTEEKPEIVFLVNAAGFGKIGLVGALSQEDELGMIDLNCRALTAVTRMALPFMRRNGRILQYASSAAFLPQPRFAIYAATKAYVLSYSQSLNQELKSRGIAVTAICPGPVKTEFFDLAEETGKIPFYKRLAMADPKKVVRLAIRDSLIGKAVSVYGPLMKLVRILSQLLPHELVLKVWYQIEEK